MCSVLFSMGNDTFAFESPLDLSLFVFSHTKPAVFYNLEQN